MIVQNHAKKLLSVEGAGVRGQAAPGLAAIQRGNRAKLRYGRHASAPGEPPRRQTGRLQGSVVGRVQGMLVRIGTNVPYGKFLERGTRYIASRPWLGRAIRECQAVMKAILHRPINW